MLVTGASRGIGAAVARRMAAEGARVAAAARTSSPGEGNLPGGLAETVAGIEAAGGRAVAVPADLSRPADRAALVETVSRELGPVDVLADNAAVTWFGPVAQARRAQLMWTVQVEAPMHLAQLVLPGMRAAGAGWIRNVSSGAARHPAVPPQRPPGGGTVHGTCKAALERSSTGPASEVCADRVAVSAVSPTAVVPAPGTLFHGPTRPGDPRSEPVEVLAGAVLALCSRPASEVSGRVAYSQELLAELGIEVPA